MWYVGKSVSSRAEDALWTCLRYLEGKANNKVVQWSALGKTKEAGRERQRDAPEVGTNES